MEVAVGLFSSIRRLGRRFGGRRSVSKRRGLEHAERVCRFEEMEKRQLLAVTVAPIQLGVVYYEDADRNDVVGDTFTVTFNGGAQGTQMSKLVIDGDEKGDGMDGVDCFFDTAGTDPEGFNSVPFSVVSYGGVGSVKATVADGSSRLTLEFTGFDPGDTLVFSIDVDEFGPSSVAEGSEFSKSRLIGTFTNTHYYAAEQGDVFVNAYNPALDASGLTLPRDEYGQTGANSLAAYTDGGFVKLTQTPLPASIAGTVFLDDNLNNSQDTNDPGLKNVTITLADEDGKTYTRQTDANGDYKFENLAPGTYHIVETQPAGIYSVGAAAGKVGSETRGTTTSNPNEIVGAKLEGGDNSVENNFAEYQLASLSGQVYALPGKVWLPGQTVKLTDSTGKVTTATTDELGRYSFTGLKPGKYQIDEVQPAGYFDSTDYVGTAGGSLARTDTIIVTWLGSGVNGTGYDFSENIPASLSGQVYAVPGKVMLSGVTVSLLDSTGKVVQTKQTSASGQYSFTGLDAGTYRVDEIQPAGYYDFTDYVGTSGGTLSGTDSIVAIKLAYGTNATGYDFSENTPASLSGKVYAEPGTVMLAGVTIKLTDSAGNVVTAKTDDWGQYSFTNLKPGTYRVDEIQPDGYYDSTDYVGSEGGTLSGTDSITSITLGAGVDATDYDFSENLPASLSGKVYAEPGTVLLAGVTVKLLDGSGNVLKTATTDDWGQYAFTNLKPGTYRVDETQPDGYYDSTDYVGSEGGTLSGTDSITSITLGAGVDATDYDFSENLPASLSGKVYAEPGTVLLAGVTVKLLDGSGNVLKTATTDDWGQYSFANLKPGTYRVDETQPDGYYDSTDFVGSEGGTLSGSDSITSITLGAGVDATDYDFSENLPATISGRVYAQPGEEPLAGVTVKLTDAAGNVVTTKTDEWGQYSFTGLKPGTYRLDEVQPDGYADSTDYPGTAGGSTSGTDSIINVSLGAGVNATGYDFSEAKFARLSGFVYLDDSNDGVKDDGELPLEGVTLVLLDANGNRTDTTTVTDAEGAYSFENLNPNVTYGVAEEQPFEYQDGLDKAGDLGGTVGDDQITGVYLSSGANAQNYNFGELRLASIGGRVWAERDRDAEYDSNESPIGGVTIYLIDTSGTRVAETTTDTDGYYLFSSVKPGIYHLEEVQPSGYLEGGCVLGTSSGATNGANRMEYISLVAAQNATQYDFWELMPASISGYVFQDGPVHKYNQMSAPPDASTLSDGKLDADDTPIANVKLTLANSDGTPVTGDDGKPIQTTTNGNGYYEFTGLEPGVYTVIEDQPTGYADSIDVAGTSGGVALNGSSDVDTSAVTATSDAIVRIQLNSGDNATDYNFTEVKLEPAPFWIPQSTPEPLPALRPTEVAPAPGVIGAIYHSLPDMASQIVVLGGASPVPSHTWHLSVINGGQPRRMQDGMELTRTQTHTYFNVASWSGMDVRQGYWVIANAKGKVLRTSKFGIRGAIPVAGDWNGDGTTELGVFLAGEWFMDLNGDGVWDQGDLWAQLGHDEDQPVSGDWDGDGKSDIGIFGPAWAGDPKAIASEPGEPDPQNAPSKTGRYKNIPPSVDDATNGYRAMKQTSQGKLRADLIDHVFHYGTSGDRAVTGDWNGDGVYTIGVFRQGVFSLDVDGDGQWSLGDVSVPFGQVGDIPLVGDWNGDGRTELGVFRNGVVILDANGDRKIDAHDTVFKLGEPGDQVVSGDFDGDGVDDVAVYREQPPQGNAPQASDGAASDEVAARPVAAPTR
jgi:protocatechuate 3,4-dioxygenase beta subunit